jgi:hypothetical protein
MATILGRNKYGRVMRMCMFKLLTCIYCKEVASKEFPVDAIVIPNKIYEDDDDVVHCCTREKCFNKVKESFKDVIWRNE